jgi:predicted MFS family arabinose efflux permease
VAAAVVPRQRTLALSLWGMTVPLGSALALAIAPPVIAEGGWRALWLAIAGLAVATALAVLLAGPRVAAVSRAARGPAGGPPPRGPLVALRSPAGWIGALIFSAYSLQFWALLNWLPTALGEVGKLSLGRAALVTAAVVMMNALGNFAGGALLRRGWSRPAMIGGASLAMGLAGIAMNQHGLPDGLRLAACFALSGCGGLIPAALVSAPPLLVERQSETGYFQGFFMQGAALGQFAGPIAAAAAVAAAGGDWAATVWVTAGAAAVAILLAALLARTALGRSVVRIN